MSRYLSDFAKGLTPYEYGEQPKDKKYIKLNTNENPYNVSEKVYEAINGTIADLRLYSDPEATKLRKAVADYFNKTLALERNDVLDDDNVFIGNGSDEVLAFTFPAFFKGGKVAIQNITYSFYPVFAKFFETETVKIMLKADFSVDIEAYIPHKDSNNITTGGLAEDITGILLCNPNAPTGRGLLKHELTSIIEANKDKAIVVDEAYIDFGGETLAGLVNRYENLLVVQTMSKSRYLAGLRVGFAVGCKEMIEGLNRVKNCFNSYTADSLAIAGGVAAIEDVEYFDETRKMIIATRERIARELGKMDFNVIPSMTNFIFVTHETKRATDLFLKLRENGILVRYFDKPLIDNYLRISIGSDEDMDEFIVALKEILNV